ncbi:MAG TPA: aminotransferase class V-fold PLP-dependent enzyme [Bacillota bacterium]|nr:aminotransferase class V-fold PLP-dependent enzyme [Bacillota bacterium]HOA15669.1 aminotransferase class V-fold PLP-dependent enzyme [Bacillota bacterium]HOG52810.1 aminotransferase class V-fold PLP-dependent enzyme [Bacillota bacterium]
MELDNINAPLFQALRKHADMNPYQFHVPGHKAGKAYPKEIFEWLRDYAMKIDLTEQPDIDCLLAASGPIKAAQENAAKVFNCDRTFFLTNGSTSGVQAMILTNTRPGAKIIMPRDAHMSAFGGMIMSGASPVFVYPDVDPKWGITKGVPYAEYERVLSNHSDIAACYITRPNYYGMCPDIRQVVKLCHEKGVPVLVDEAHGAHIGFHSEMPYSALESGADYVTQSAHKTLQAFTGGSWLHLQGPLSDPDKASRMVSLLQSTSPSYIIMATLDLTSYLMGEWGNELVNKQYKLNKAFRKEAAKLKGVRIIEESAMDPLRITVSASDLGLSGIELDMILRTEYRVCAEMADLENVVIIQTVGDDEETMKALLDALIDISHRFKADPKKRSRLGRQVAATWLCMQSSPVRMTMRDAAFSESETIPLTQAVGCVASETVSVYPPGIPAIIPGEEVTAEKAVLIMDLARSGYFIKGLRGAEDFGIRVVKHEK